MSCPGMQESCRGPSLPGRGSGNCRILERHSSIMAIDRPRVLHDLENIEYFGIGIGAALAAPSSQGARSQSPGGSSISLEPSGETRHFLYKDNTNSLQLRRLSTPSPDSLVTGDETTFRGVILEEEDARQVAQPDDEYPATPVASSSSSLSTTPTFAGPLESYLACPQSHEERALSRPRDDGQEQPTSSSDPGSLVMSPGDSRLGYLMSRYLASEEDGEFLEGHLGHMCSKDGNDETPKTPSMGFETAQSSGDAPFGPDASIALTTSSSIGNVAPVNTGVLDGPIEAGSDHQNPDSGISDIEADELHHLL
ncbi:hypothetical protein LX36DRAFT_682965 [Colletotrichum falcatum]|nr:hypothetical protein LX36DRAFT_682965 [Colletotrichum falcatum]